LMVFSWLPTCMKDKNLEIVNHQSSHLPKGHMG
jgi:hypothetical protein